MLVFTCIFCLNSIAQNLVMNGGFEAPTNTSMFGTYVVKSGYVSVGQGSQFKDSDASLYEQKIGKKSAGCFTWNPNKYFQPETIVLNLREKLIKDKWYEVSYFIKHGFGLYATNCNGIAFTTAGSFYKDYKIPFKTLSTVNIAISKQIISHQEWKRYSFLYKAKGGENAILIGHVFYQNKIEIDTLKTPKERYKDAMTLYMFDDVMVIRFENKLYSLFEKDSANLQWKEQIMLDDLVDYLSTISYSKISLIGYSDKTGIPEKNTKLSEHRAKTISDYLLAKGINSSLLFTQSFGGTDAFDKDNLGLNRRVEIIIE